MGVFNKLKTFAVRSLYCILALVMIICLGCEWRLRPDDNNQLEAQLTIDRYDVTERLFLTTGDYAALQQLKTIYPMQTRILIEDVLRLGLVCDSDIDIDFFSFFQDSTLQKLLADVELEYADLSDVQRQLSMSF